MTLTSNYEASFNNLQSFRVFLKSQKLFKDDFVLKHSF